MSKLIKDINIIMEALKLIPIKNLKFDIKKNISKEIESKLEMFSLTNFISLKNEELTNEENKQFLKKELFKKIKETKKEELFYLYYLVEKIGIFDYSIQNEIFIKIINKSLKTELLKDIIIHLNNYEMLSNRKLDCYSEVLKNKLAIHNSCSINNPGILLSIFLSNTTNIDYNYILKELKTEAYLYTLINFDFQWFANSLESIIFLKRNTRYLYNFLLSIDSLSEKSILSDNKILKLKRIIEENFDVMGKQIIKQVYTNVHVLKDNQVLNKIIKNIFKDNEKREKYLKNLEWGNDFLNFSKYLIVNERSEKGRVISKDSLFYSKAFLENYKSTNNKLFDFYYADLKSECQLTIALLSIGLAQSPEYLDLLEEELLTLKYQYFSTEFDTIYNLNIKVSEIIIIHLYMFFIENISEKMTMIIKKSITLIENIILDSFIFNLKSFYMIEKEKNLIYQLDIILYLLKEIENKEEIELKKIYNNLLLTLNELYIKK